MAETKKAKKLRIYKLASDINISSEAIVDFLKEKEYKIKSHMTLLTDDMLADIYSHFKKDIDKSDEHKRKLANFNKMRADKAESDSLIDEEESVEITSSTEVEEEGSSEEVEVDEAEVSDSDIEEDTVDSETPIVDEEDSFQTEAEKEIHGKKKGLTVVGKIELKSESKKRGKKKESEEKGETKKSPGSPQTEKKEITEEVHSKRKKLKAKKKTGNIEETVKAKKFKRVKKAEVDKREVEAAIKRTMLSMDDTATGDRASHKKMRKKIKIE